ncbi:MAG: hypothetical protein U0973_07540 [Xanthomonadaceae bacterium]|nr:hypothetical protein [Xanthomonadaceae bacterium]
MGTQKYRAVTTFYHQNARCVAGSEIELTAEQAQYLLHGGFVELAAAVDDASPDANGAETADAQDADAAPRRRKGGGA